MSSERFSIVHVLNGLGAGGAERFCLELCRHAPAGVPQTLINVGQQGGALDQEFRAIPGLTLVAEPYSRDARLRFIGRMSQRLREARPAGAICYAFGLHVLVSIAAKTVSSCRVLAWLGNPPLADGSRAALFRILVFASRCLKTPLFSCSQSVHDGFRRLGAKMPEGSTAAPPGVDTLALQRAATRGRAGRSSAAPVIAMVARLNRIKDHGTLLTAFARVRERVPSARLWLIGDGELRWALESQARALGLAASALFMGVRSDIGELLGKIDVFAFSTTSDEGFGIALAEAMAVGLPIVASDVPACREVLSGRCGELVRPRDPAALANAILGLLTDPARAQRLGCTARLRAEHAYSIAACARRYYDYFLPASSKS